MATEALCEYTARAQYADLDATTIAKTKQRVLDLIGCAFGGAAAPANAGLVDIVRIAGGAPQASVIGYRVKGPVGQVAMTNAVISRAYDFEVMTVVVGDRQVASHHSPTTCMTALALSEHGKLPGKDFLLALTIGDDIAARMLAASGLDFGQGWDGAPIYSTIAAAAIASRLSGLSSQQTQDAFGLAVNTISGTIQNIWDGATDWKLPQGLAARNGIFAAQLAASGWVGMGDALRAPYGFFRQYTAGCTHPEVLTADLGKRYYAEEYFKPYPACAATHLAIDCALDVHDGNKYDVTDITRIAIRQPASAFNSFVAKPFEMRRHPHCDANFSTQFQVANAVANGITRIEHYAAASLQSPRMLALLDKTVLEPFSSPAQQGVEIEVSLRDGRKIVSRASGRPRHNPAEKGTTYAQLVEKFHYQARVSGFISPEHANQIVARIDTLEAETNMAEFMGLVTRTYLPARS
ncbi:MAG: MmgE/PrpD family protein [Pseudomonadota bacterium]